MEISSFLIRIIFLAIPGIITYLIYYRLVRRGVKTDWESVLKIMLFSLINYLILALIMIISNIFNTKWEFKSYDAVFNENIILPGNEILFASLIGIILAFCLALIKKTEVINLIGRKLKVTTLVSDEDVWDDFLNAEGDKWIYVRDHKRNVIYFGWIELYSETSKERELVIRDVQVYDDSEQRESPLYELDAVYISRQSDYITLEIPGQ